jgi:Amt family ammonium transporter
MGRLIERRPLGLLQVVLALVAVSVLWIGWLTLMELDLNRFTPTIVANSIILAATSLVAALGVERVATGRNSAAGAAIGLITGLASATAACAFLVPVTAGTTGLLAGAVAAGIAFRKRSGDRSLARAIAITNLVGGITGLLMVGLLEPSRGFFYTGSFALPVAQGTAVIVCVVYSALVCVPLALMTSRRQAKENS